MSHSEPTQTDEDERDVQVPEPEVLPRAKRRRFSAEYKLRILEEVDGCTQRGQIGALLRREGLYSSHLSTWRQQRLLGQLEGLSPKKRGRKPQDPAVEEAARLRRENERLRARLEQAEMIIDVQKKLSQLLGLTPDETEMDESE
jgi:transposase-like protein